jgi:MFS family permease
MAVDSSIVVDAKFDFRHAIQIFRKDRLWPFYMMAGFCVGVPLFSVSNFLPQIVARLGYDTVKTNLYTVAPNIAGSIFLVIVAFSSDYFMERSLHLATCLAITCVGFIVLAAIDVTKNIGVGYFCCFLLCCGGFITSPLLSTWYNNNTPDENHRAILTPVLVATANSMGLVSANIFVNRDAPKYIMASIISACFGGAGVLVVLGIGLYMKMDNRKRDKMQGVVIKPTEVITSELNGDQNDPNWRWMGGLP